MAETVRWVVLLTVVFGGYLALRWADERDHDGFHAALAAWRASEEGPMGTREGQTPTDDAYCDSIHRCQRCQGTILLVGIGGTFWYRHQGQPYTWVIEPATTTFWRTTGRNVQEQIAREIREFCDALHWFESCGATWAATDPRLAAAIAPTSIEGGTPA